MRINRLWKIILCLIVFLPKPGINAQMAQEEMQVREEVQVREEMQAQEEMQPQEEMQAQEEMQPQEEIQPQVQDVVTTSGQFERLIVVRMKQGADLLNGLNSAVEKEAIKNAVILSGIGSLVSYHIHVVDNNTFPTENIFIKNETPVDLTSVNGYIFDGRVHAHINVSDERLALGGHLEPGNEVFTFAIITVGVFNDEVNLARFDDKYWK